MYKEFIKKVSKAMEYGEICDHDDGCLCNKRLIKILILFISISKSFSLIEFGEYLTANELLEE